MEKIAATVNSVNSIVKRNKNNVERDLKPRYKMQRKKLSRQEIQKQEEDHRKKLKEMTERVLNIYGG